MFVVGILHLKTSVISLEVEEFTFLSRLNIYQYHLFFCVVVRNLNTASAAVKSRHLISTGTINRFQIQNNRLRKVRYVKKYNSPDSVRSVLVSIYSSRLAQIQYRSEFFYKFFIEKCLDTVCVVIYSI